MYEKRDILFDGNVISWYIWSIFVKPFLFFKRSVYNLPNDNIHTVWQPNSYVNNDDPNGPTVGNFYSIEK